MKIILDLQYQHMIKLPLSSDDMNRLPGSSWINLFYAGISALDHEILFSGNISEDEEVTGALLISEMFTSYTDKMMKKGAIPFLVFSQESPNVSKSFYKTYTVKYNYQYAYLFPGSFDFFGRLEHNIDLFWPNSTTNLPERQEQKDIFIGMIASNKQTFNRRFSFLPTKLEQFIKSVAWKNYFKRLSHSGYTDLYFKRLQAIDYFSGFSDFSLYGRGWNQMNTLSKELFDKIQKIKPLEIENKMEILSKMKFSICFENFIFPGYVTEKIFDCLLTGAIPIYLGAPDIEKYVPEAAFIDGRKFSSFSEINQYVRALKQDEVLALQQAGRDFLSSPDYSRFTDVAFADQMLQLVVGLNAY